MMINTSYEMAIQTYVTKKNLDELDQSRQSHLSAPSDKLSQHFGAYNNKEYFDSYQFHKTQEQYGKTPDERYEREKRVK